MAKSPNWTQEEHNLLLEIGHKYNTEELLEFFPNRSAVSIKSRKSKFNIKTIHEKKYAFKVDQSILFSDLSQLEQDVLIGSMFGDGSVSSNGKKSFYFKEGHSIPQLDYLYWKGQVLSRFFPYYYPDGDMRLMQLVNHNIFREFRSKFYPFMYKFSYKTIIPFDYVEKFSYTSLMIYFFDDGHFSRSGSSISAERFDRTELSKMLDIINKKLDLGLYIPTTGRQIIKINKENQNKLFPIFQELFKEHKLPDCMKYKFGY